jgi:alanine racemase
MNQLKSTRPVWAEINLDNLAHNIGEVKRNIKPSTLVCAVIKADGYGHGAVHIAKTLLENGADRFAVATLSEAIQLRKAYKDIPIMILGYTPDDLAEKVVVNNLIQTVFSLEQAKVFAEVAEKHGQVQKIHIKLDTGMKRVGMPITDVTVDHIMEIAQMEALNLEGIFTHFATADETDKTFTKLQVERFLWVVSALEARGLNIPIKHVSNSAAIIDCPEYNFDMVRAGIMLYGLYPSKDVDHNRIHLKEAMSLKAEIAQVKTIEAGEGVSYGLKYVAPERTQIATLPLGYADGLLRCLTHKAMGIVKDEIKPLVGRICMDQCMMEVNGIPVTAGDEVTLFGKTNNRFISIDTYADLMDTINYEIVCLIGKRVPRKYVQNNKVVHFEDFNLSNELSPLW